uniref:Uncharacterized protein n=1 Tax=Staphylothermus marinus TaxID=2280 RepID=A0A7C4NML2_STAMA
MKINLKILIPILIAVIVAVLVTTMLLIPRGAGEAEIESPTTTETTTTPTTTIEETQTIGLSIVGVSVGYYDYFDPYNPEKVSAGKAGLIDVNITFEGYGIVKQIILKIKNYGNLTIVSEPFTISTTQITISTTQRETKRFSLELSMNERNILDSLKNYRVDVIIIYEENGLEKYISRIVIPLDLSKLTTTPR